MKRSLPEVFAGKKGGEAAKCKNCNMQLEWTAGKRNAGGNAMEVRNPILRGFHPDPSIIRTGEDYYIANSTFEWWPGIRIHHSKDLKHWELIEYPLDRTSQLDLRGAGASQGVWAPCLTYDENGGDGEGIFYLVYTVVRSFYCNMYDTANYLVTTKDIHGQWSEPVALNNFGFDPSLFHDDDGRKYMVSMVTDHRIPKKYKGRIILQEYDPVKRTMTGPVRDIYTGDRVYLEGPHILKRNGYYYLFCADTGTGEGHGQSILRSGDIWGPYEWNEENSIMTARNNPDFPLQKSGHCDLVETPEGEWYAVHLCGRPLENRNPPDARRFAGERRYTLGRETAVQKMEWTKDGWLRLANGSKLPDAVTKLPDRLTEQAEMAAGPLDRLAKDESGQTAVAGKNRDDFDLEELDLEYQSLRVPMTEHFLSLTERPGYLRMYGREGLSSKFGQTLIARRWTEFVFEADTKLEFEPEVFKQMAGLICMYDTDNYFYLHVTYDEDMGKCISILTAENKVYAYPAGYLPVKEGAPVYLKVRVSYDKLQFCYGVGKEEYRKIGPVFDASVLSDEACDEGWFTGAMTGICCQDLTGSGKYADFDWFTYNTGLLEEDSERRNYAD